MTYIRIQTGSKYCHPDNVRAPQKECGKQNEGRWKEGALRSYMESRDAV